MADRSQVVLELVVEHINDPKTLSACSLVNKQLDALTSTHIQQHLPSLLLALVNHDSPCMRQGLKWLHYRAGPAPVNSPSAQAAFLQLLSKAENANDAAEMVGRATMAGLQSSWQLVVSAAKQHHPYMCVLAEMLESDIGWEGLYPTALHAVVINHANEFAYDSPDVVISGTTAMCHIEWSALTAEDLPDLLRVACNHSCGTGMALALLQEDARRLNVLCPAVADGAASSTQQPAWLQPAAVHLVCELLATCIASSHHLVVQALVALPAMQQIGPNTAARLLYMTLLKASRDSSAAGALMWDTSLWRQWLALPGCKAMSSESVASLLRLSMSMGASVPVGALLQLPGCQSFSSEEVCGLLREAYPYTSCAAKIVQEFGRYLAGRQLDRAHVMDLIKHSMAAGSTFAPHPDLHLGQHLTGDDVIALLWHILDCGADASVFVEVPNLLPAADSITDLQGLAAVLQGLAKTTLYHAVPELLMRLSVSVKLQPQQCGEVLLSCLERGAPIPDDMVSKGLRDAKPELLGKALLFAIATKRYSTVQTLAALPGAQHLSSLSLSGLLWQCTAPPKICIAAVACLLPLPGVQQLQRHEVVSLFGCMINRLCVPCVLLLKRHLDVCSQLFEDLAATQVSRLLLRAAERGDNGSVLALLARPKAQAIWSGELATIAAAAAAAPKPCVVEVVQQLQRLPAAHHIDRSGLGNIIASIMLNKALTGCDAGSCSILQAWLQFPPVMCLPAADLLHLLSFLVSGQQSGTAEMWRQLLQLPGAQGLDGSQVDGLVQSLLARISCCNHCQQLLALVLRLPGANQLDARTVLVVGNACLQHRRYDMFECVLGLRGALDLSAEDLKPWLRRCVHRGDTTLVAKLAKLPGLAPGSAVASGVTGNTGAEVALLLDGMKGVLDDDAVFQ